jgi:hypothetical protein
MSIIANTFTRYDSVGIREDLSNIIYNIDPTDRPFMSNMTKSRKVTNTFFEWQTQSLSSASSNHHIDGDDISSFTAVTPTVRLGNYTNISRKDFIIADNLNGAIDAAGRRAEVAYQMSLKGKELANDQEHNLCGLNHAAVAGNNTTARKTATLSAFLRTNTSRGSGGANPTVSSGVVNAAATDGTQRAMTEAHLKTVLQGCWTNGGAPKFVMVGPHVKTVISGFAGIAAQRYMAPSDGPTTIIGAADVYLSDFGQVSIVPSRLSRARDAYVIDPDLVEVATLRPMQTEELAKTGDASKYLMLVEYGLQVSAEDGLGVVADLSTS